MTTSIAPEGLLHLEPQPNGDHPAWLTELRRAAFEWVREHGFPTRKDEEWRYTRLGPILETPFVPAVSGMGHGLSSSIIDALAADLGGTRLVFVNGHFASEFSSLAELPAGATVTNLASLLAEDAEDAEEAEGIEQLLSRPFGEDHHAFTALNSALTEDGAFIHLQADTIVDEPIHLVFFSDTGGSPLVSSPRSLVLAGPRSQVVIVETHVGVSGDIYCSNPVTEVFLEEGAAVEHYKIQDESETAFHIALLDVRQSRDSRFSSQSVALGASIARHEVRVSLEDEGAEVSLDGLYMPRGNQHHDNPILIDHAAPHCTSRQLYKGVLDGHGQGVFNGRVVVRPGAAGSDSAQTNKNLLLSDYAEVDTRPRLEILADDVKCTHGATVGRLDEDAVFYLRSRGIPHLAARGLLIYAFVNEMVKRLKLEPIRSRVEQLVAQRLATGNAEVQT